MTLHAKFLKDKVILLEEENEVLQKKTEVLDIMKSIMEERNNNFKVK